MKIVLSVDESLERNAARFFDESKTAKKKAEGAIQAIQRLRAELHQETARETAAQRVPQAPKKRTHWYEKFRWFISSEGFLCVGGRDASSNEALIKRHAEPHDIVFHTEMSGSPFFVVKTEGNVPGEITKKEAAIATVTFSRAWKRGLATTDVYSVQPEQLSKTAASGEYVSKGAFIVTGKRDYQAVQSNLAIGVREDGTLMSGPGSAVEHHCVQFAQITPGDDKPSQVAATLAKRWQVHPDDIIFALPAGTCSLGAIQAKETKDI